MKRARHTQGSVVCDKRRRVWNFLFCGLDPVSTGNGHAPRIFADQLEQRLKRRLTNEPVATPSFVQTILIAKRE